MRTTVVDGGVQTTVLGFGCASLLDVPSRRGRRHLLAAAYDHGIRHFDVAPMYGLGAAEHELGRFLTGQRDRIVVATKFGIEPTRFARRLAPVQAPLRAALALTPSLRRLGRVRPRGPYASGRHDPSFARASLERSLRALGTDYVDLLLLHEPTVTTVPVEAIQTFLDDAQRRGDIRAWGVAGEPGPTLDIWRAFGDPRGVLQVRGDILNPAPRADGHPRISFGVLTRALALIVRHVRSDEMRRGRWRDAVGADCADPGSVAPLLLRHALHAHPGVVLFSTRRHRRLAAAVHAAEPSTPAIGPNLDAFVTLVDSEIRSS